MFYVQHIARHSVLSNHLKGKIKEENIVFYQWNFDNNGMKATYSIRKNYNTNGDITASYYLDNFGGELEETFEYKYSQPGFLSEVVSTITEHDEDEVPEKPSVYRSYYKNVLNADGKIGLIQSHDSLRYNKYVENILHCYYKDFEMEYVFYAMNGDTVSRLVGIIVSGSGKWGFGHIRIGVTENFPLLNANKFASNGLINDYSLLTDKYKPKLINENAFEITIHGVKHLYLRNYKDIFYTRDTIKLGEENIISKLTRITLLDENNYKLQEIGLKFLDNGTVDESRHVYNWQTMWMGKKKRLKIYSIFPNGKEYTAKYVFRFKNRSDKTNVRVTFWSYHDLYKGR
ncbi:MAG: hypothetical protein IT236_05055 [Bacteroidia bacterium]|nr:hypothetical protein [Bacteroidia bacterium]